MALSYLQSPITQYQQKYDCCWGLFVNSDLTRNRRLIFLTLLIDIYNTPNTGDLPGAWGTSAINPNMASLDGTLGGFQTISLSSATTFALTLPAGASFTPGAGPSQSENALIKFTGQLTGNAVVQFNMPGYYIVHNNCGSAASFYIQLAPSSGPGNIIAAPPGRKCHVFFDGTDMDYVDMPEVGAALDLHQSTTALPAWMNACTVKPYLVKDGSVYNASAYTALAQNLGSTFGGNGISTFGVPDERGRMRAALDTLSVNTGTYAGRLTLAGSGVNGTTMGAIGGSEFLQSHAHTATITDPGHAHEHSTVAAQMPVEGSTIGVGSGIGCVADPFGGGKVANIGLTDSTTTLITAAVNGTGSGSGQNVPPTVVSFIALIKT